MSTKLKLNKLNKLNNNNNNRKSWSSVDFRWHNSVALRLLFVSTSGIGLSGKQSGLDTDRWDVQLATGPPPLGHHHGHRQQFTPSVFVRHHGRYAAHKQGHFFFSPIVCILLSLQNTFVWPCTLYYYY